MNRKKGGFFFYIGGAVLLCVGIIMCILFLPLHFEENITLPWLIVVGVIAVIAAVFMLVFGYKRITSLDEESVKKMEEYASIPYAPIADYKAELEETRNNFYADASPDKNLPHMRYYPQAADCYDYSVINKGNIYYGYIVQAADMGFKKQFNLMGIGGVIVYSPDEYFESNPLKLKEIAHAIYKKRYSNILKDESDFFTNLRLPDSQTEGREVYMTSMMIYRMHLPTGYLSDSLFPVIANPKASRTVLAADVKYWSKNLVANFVHGGSFKEADEE